MVKLIVDDAAKTKTLMQSWALMLLLAEWTGLEPATPGVTGRYSNQLNYHSTLEGADSATGGGPAQEKLTQTLAR